MWPHLHAGDVVGVVQEVVVGRSRVELFEAIRRDHAEGGISIRGLADRHGVKRPRFCAAPIRVPALD